MTEPVDPTNGYGVDMVAGKFKYAKSKPIKELVNELQELLTELAERLDEDDDAGGDGT